MDFTKLLPKFAVVEVGKLAGLLNGHIVAQTKYIDEDATYLENGHILYLNTSGELVKADGTNPLMAQPFLHYTEELLTFMAGMEYFAVELEDGVCYPRAIGLYEGDEFTTNNIANLDEFDDWDEDEAWVIVDDGELTLVDAFPAADYEGPVFKAMKDTLPAGQDAVALKLLVKFVDLA